MTKTPPKPDNEPRFGSPRPDPGLVGRFAFLTDQDHVCEITEAGTAIQVDRHTSAVLDPVTGGWDVRHFKALPNGRTYELVNGRWHRVK